MLCDGTVVSAETLRSRSPDLRSPSIGLLANRLPSGVLVPSSPSSLRLTLTPSAEVARWSMLIDAARAFFALLPSAPASGLALALDEE